MVAYKCDRCGTLYEYNCENYLGKHYISKECHPYDDMKIDLCPKCQEKLEQWLKSKE